MKIQFAAEIKTTPEKLWYWLGTPERAAVWQTNVGKTEILKSTPDMVGTTFRETIEEDGNGTDMEGVVTDYRENQALAMHLSGKYNVVDIQWLIEKRENQYTRLTVQSDIRFKSFLKILSIVIRPVFKKKITEQLQADFIKLKGLCEKEN